MVDGVVYNENNVIFKNSTCDLGWGSMCVCPCVCLDGGVSGMCECGGCMHTHIHAHIYTHARTHSCTNIFADFHIYPIYTTFQVY